MKKILVTGGSGLIGTSLKTKIPQATYVSSKDYDLTNQLDVERMFYDHNPHAVVHLAANVGGILDNLAHPVSHLDDNILINTLVLKFSHKYNVKQFLSILSPCVYPDVCDTYPISESFMHKGPPTESTFSYGMSKRIMAIQIENYNKEFGTKYNYIIPCNLYGPNDKEDKFIPALINKISKAKKNNDSFIELFGDGTPIRQFLHSSDMSNIIKYVIENNITDSFNVASDEVVTINDIAKIALSVTGSEFLNIKYDTTKPNGQIRRDLEISKFKKIMPSYKCISLYDGISEYYKNIKNE
jgi:GDP-L-fucose synthase